MATSSILENFVVEGRQQAEIVANAIEESYQESLTRDNGCHVNYQDIHGKKAIKKLVKTWKKLYEK